MKKYLFLAFLFIFLFFPFKIFADEEIYEQDLSISEISDSIIEASSTPEKVPQVNARHAVVFDRYSKRILYGKKENDVCKMASTTKIMTAIVVLENSNLNDIVKISKSAAQTGGSRLGLSTNDSISVDNLLYGLMMKSGNDAAVALAEHVGDNLENFALMMNAKAKSLGLSSTHFVTPHGLDNDEHYTTAYDLAILTDYALQNETFSKIVKTKNYTVSINGNPKNLSNTNELLGNYEGIYGVKTGFTNGANRCLVTSCKQNNMDVICVVLGSDTKKNRTVDSVKLLNYIFKNYSLVNVKDIIIDNFEKWNDSNKNRFNIYKGISNDLDVYLNYDDFKFSHMAVKKNDINNIRTEVVYNSYFEAPVYSKSHIGNIILKINTNDCLSVELLNNNTVERKSCLNYLFSIFKNYSNCFKNSLAIF